MNNKSSRYTFGAALAIIFMGLMASTAFSQQDSPSQTDPSAAVAVSFTEALSQKDYAQMDQLMDVDAFCKAISEVVYENQIKRKLFMVRECSFYKNSSFTKQLFSANESRDLNVKYIGKNSEGLETIRILSEAGIEFYELVFDEGEDPKIVDIFLATSGEFVTQRMAQAFGMLLVEDESILRRMTGLQKQDTSLAQDLLKIIRESNKGNFAGAHDLILNLPEEVQSTRLVSLMRMSMAAMIDETTYYEAMAQIDRLFGDDPALTMTLIDFYFFENNIVKLKQSLSKLKDRYGDDASIANLEANFEFINGNVTQALNVLDTAIAKEPDLFDIHLTRFYILFSQDRVPDALDALKEMRRLFGDEQIDLLIASDPSLAEFE